MADEDEDRIVLDQVFYDEAVLEKLWTKHELEQWEVDEALENPVAGPRWHVDPEHGRRVLLIGVVGDRVLLIALNPVVPEQGIWRCRTAFELSEEEVNEWTGDLT